ncbi:Transposase [Popillia japonica]|uniref:Transposase n=1 Tax=Popillia japonica TaxID=7064 RepID=A0AAW1HFC6_POPJA
MPQNALKYKKRAEKRGRPRKTSTHMNRRILLAIKKDPFASSSKILTEVDADISARTDKRRLLEFHIKSRSPRKVPLLQKRHLKNGLGIFCAPTY